MYYIIFVTLLTVVAADKPAYYSVSPSVGSNTGTWFDLRGDGRISAVRTWELMDVVYGIQLCFGDTWTAFAGTPVGPMQTFKLSQGEAIVQVSGKFTCYINWLVLVTSSGRSFFTGQPSGRSFNMYPEHQGAELLFITGTAHGALTGLSTHWAVTGLPLDSHCCEDDTVKTCQ